MDHLYHRVVQLFLDLAHFLNVCESSYKNIFVFILIFVLAMLIYGKGERESVTMSRDPSKSDEHTHRSSHPLDSDANSIETVEVQESLMQSVWQKQEKKSEEDVLIGASTHLPVSPLSLPPANDDEEDDPVVTESDSSVFLPYTRLLKIICCVVLCC